MSSVPASAPSSVIAPDIPKVDRVLERWEQDTPLSHSLLVPVQQWAPQRKLNESILEQTQSKLHATRLIQARLALCHHPLLQYMLYKAKSGQVSSLQGFPQVNWVHAFRQTEQVADRITLFHHLLMESCKEGFHRYTNLCALINDLHSVTSNQTGSEQKEPILLQWMRYEPNWFREALTWLNAAKSIPTVASVMHLNWVHPTTHQRLEEEKAVQQMIFHVMHIVVQQLVINTGAQGEQAHQVLIELLDTQARLTTYKETFSFAAKCMVMYKWKNFALTTGYQYQINAELQNKLDEFETQIGQKADDIEARIKALTELVLKNVDDAKNKVVVTISETSELVWDASRRAFMQKAVEARDMTRLGLWYVYDTSKKVLVAVGSGIVSGFVVLSDSVKDTLQWVGSGLVEGATFLATDIKDAATSVGEAVGNVMETVWIYASFTVQDTVSEIAQRGDILFQRVKSTLRDKISSIASNIGNAAGEAVDMASDLATKAKDAVKNANINQNVGKTMGDIVTTVTFPQKAQQ